MRFGGEERDAAMGVDETRWRHKYFARLTTPVQFPIIAVHSSRREARGTRPVQGTLEASAGYESSISTYPAVVIGKGRSTLRKH